MPSIHPKLTMILSATAAAALSSVAIAGAASSSATSTPTASTAQHHLFGGKGGPGRGTALTGTTKTKAEAAALAKVAGTVLRSETDPKGGYRVLVQKADGTVSLLHVDKTFEVTSTQAAFGRGGRGGRGGHGDGFDRGADSAAVAKAIGVTQAQLQTAVEAARPTSTARPDRGADRAAAIAKTLGQSTADVQAVIDATFGSGDGHRGRDHDENDTALVTALAKKFSVTQTQAQAAVDAAEKAEDAAHEARETAFYAAVAKALDKDAAAVQKAF